MFLLCHRSNKGNRDPKRLKFRIFAQNHDIAVLQLIGAHAPKSGARRENPTLHLLHYHKLSIQQADYLC